MQILLNHLKLDVGLRSLDRRYQESHGTGNEHRACPVSGNLGFDAARKEYVDLVQVGIVDPTKVAREKAIEIANALLAKGMDEGKAIRIAIAKSKE
jgi:chaperonin GroEL (HSP60 family)